MKDRRERTLSKCEEKNEHGILDNGVTNDQIPQRTRDNQRIKMALKCLGGNVCAHP